VIRTSIRLVLACSFVLLVSTAGFAQASASDDDAVLKPAEPDFTLISLPTALRLPLHRLAFRVTHRFSLPLNDTDEGDLWGQLFGIDSAAVVGLEVRFGIVKNGQIVVHHTNDNRTWEFLGQYGIVRQDRGLPIDLTAIASVEIPRTPVPRTDNFERQAVTAAGAILSRTFHEHAAVYVEPIYVNDIFNEFNTPSSSDNTLMLGVGGRWRILSTVYLVAEAAPRVAGYHANPTHGAFAIEKRLGGHVFQLNVSNSFATTLGELAMGGDPSKNWHLGFNISRKFY
jgi:hypothetical protein